MRLHALSGEECRGDQQVHGLAYPFISHDLAVVHAFADRTMVTKAGRVVEEGDIERIFGEPREVCTRRLMAAAFGLGASSNARA